MLLNFLFSTEGRISPKQYRNFCLGAIVTYVGVAFIEGFLSSYVEINGWLIGPFFVLLFISATVVKVKRFHDLDESGYNIFLFLIPLYNWYVWYQLCRKAGTDGENRYGYPPNN